MPSGVKVMHYLPGRLRLRIAALKDCPELVRTMECELSDVPGIRRVEARCATGSLLLEYDSSALKSREAVEKLRGAARRMLGPADVAQLDSYLDRLM